MLTEKSENFFSLKSTLHLDYGLTKFHGFQHLEANGAWINLLARI